MFSSRPSDRTNRGMSFQTPLSLLKAMHLSVERSMRQELPLHPILSFSRLALLSGRDSMGVDIIVDTQRSVLVMYSIRWSLSMNIGDPWASVFQGTACFTLMSFEPFSV